MLDKIAAGLGSSVAEIGIGQYLQRKAYNKAMDADNTKIRRTVADAKAAGIHPLAALGVNMGSGPSISVGADPGSAMSVFKKGLDQVTNPGPDPYTQNMQDLILEEKLNQESLKKHDIAADIQLKLAKITEMGGSPLGTRENPIPMFKYYKDPYSGKIVPSPNEEFAEGGEGSIGSKAFIYGGAQELQR